MKKIITLLCFCTITFLMYAQCPITNGDFGNGLTGWNVTGDVQVINNAARICSPQTGFNQVFATQPGKVYDVSFFAQTDTDHGFTVYQIRSLDSNWMPLEINGSGGVRYAEGSGISGGSTFSTYRELSNQITTPPDAAWFQVSIWHENGGCINIADVSVCESAPPPSDCTNDIEPPTINLCPGNFLTTTTSTTTTTSAPISWTEPTATDNCSTPTLMSSYPLGSVFSIGTTEVEYTATDNANNSTTCSFNIVVSQASEDRPDLQINNLTFGNANVVQGNTLNFSYDLINSGPQPASGDFYMTGYISTDEVIGTDDFSFRAGGFIGAGFFAPNFTRNLAGSVQIPTSLALGDYYLITVADAGSNIPESNENNNTHISQTKFTIQNGNSTNGNLVLETIDVDINQWNTGTVEFLLRNTGPESIYDIEVDFNFSDDIRLVGGNEYESYQNTTLNNSWTQNPTWEAGVIAQGGVKFIRFNVYSITNDPMYIYGQVASATGTDSNSTPGNGTPPTPNEDDEAIANINGGTPPNSDTDLSIQSINFLRFPNAVGDFFAYEFELKNDGPAMDPNKPFEVNAFISVDRFLSGGDIPVGGTTLSGLANNSVETVNGSSTLPALSNGNYYLILKADDSEKISETNENNNTQAIPFTIPNPVSQVDLTIRNLVLNELTVKSGDVLTYNFDIANIGFANVPQNFIVRAYLSTDGDISADDIQDGIVPTGNFDAGLLVQDVLGASTINLPEGQYYLLLRVDADNQVNESDESNNDLQANIQFTVDNTPGGSGSVCDKQIAQDVNSFNCIETNAANGNINVVYNTTNGVIEKTLNQNLDIIGSTTLAPLEKPTFVLDDVTLTKTNADGSVAYTRTVPQAFADKFVYRPQLIEFMSGFVFFGRISDGTPTGSILTAVKTDTNFNILKEEAVSSNPDPRISYVNSMTEVNGNIAFILGSSITFGSSAVVKLWDANLNELDDLPLFSGVWQGGASLSENACRKFTVTDGVGLGYCKSGGCYRSENREVEFTNNSIQVNSYYGVEHRTTLGVGYENYNWRANTSDGGTVTAKRNQNLTGSSTSVPDDAQVIFTKRDANGNVQWEKDYLITDWEKVFRVYESAGTIYILKNVDGELLISDLECYDLPTDLADLEITNVNAPSSGAAGSTFFFDFKLSNNGTIASGESTVALYFSRDDRLGFDSQIGSTFPSFASVPAGSSLNGGTSGTLPNFSPGNYYLLIVADADGDVVESNENNNLTAIPFEIVDTQGGGVDLELSFVDAGANPSQWSVFTTTVTVTNSGGEPATGVEVEFRPTPVGAVYQGGNEGMVSQGTFKSWENTWEVGTLAPGATATLDVNLFRVNGGNFVMYSQVSAQNEIDIDSAPNNGVCCAAGEDDEDQYVIGNAVNGINNRNAIVQNLGNQPFAIVTAMPNPFTDQFKLQVFSNENQESEITVMNAMGQAIFKKEVNLNEGLNTIPVNFDSDASGILMVKMTPFHPYLRQIRVMRVRD